MTVLPRSLRGAAGDVAIHDARLRKPLPWQLERGRAMDCFAALAMTKAGAVQRETFQPAVYMMANHKSGTIYVGVTSDLMQRAWQHREGVGDGFTKRYGCKRLIWFELHGTMEYAILREKQLKAGSRAKKIALIEDGNPEWRDLYGTILG